MKPVTKPSPPAQCSFFREEREDGAVYEVSLKKVRYRRSGNYLVDTIEEPVSHLQWETILVRKIKAGTLKKLVDNLVSEKDSLSEDMDPGYLMAFLSTYRAFAEVHDVLELLIQRCLVAQERRFESPEKSVRIMKGIIGVLMVWLDQFPSDFNEPPNFTDLKRLNNFVNHQLEGDIKKDLAKKITEKLQTFIITPYESEGDPIGFRLSMLRDVDYIVEADKTSGSYEGLDFDLLSINPESFAEQLTLMDAELFRKVIPWHCLGSVWSNRRRSKDTHNTAKPTVDQFNAVSLRVISTILTCSSKKSTAPSKRAQYITRWIEIAKECRDIKNFSSLRAIISGLQSASIHRLRKSWMNVPREKQLLFSELSSIFSEDKNQKMSRELLMKEGTAKRPESEMSGTKRPSMKKRRSRFLNSESVMQGTVPYLGTFLTDLTMIDTVNPDYTEDGLINFDKRRKEFEIIAQIKLLQEAAKNYNIVPNGNFRHTFDSLMTFSEAESFKISCDIEKDSTKKRPTKLSLRRNQSDPDLSSSVSLLSLSLDRNVLRRQESKSTENSPVLARHQRNNSSGSSSSSSGICSGSEAPTSKGLTIPIKRRSSPCFSRLPSSPVTSNPWSPNKYSSSPSPYLSFGGREAGYIIRVSLEDDENSGLVYKGVWLSQSERTSTVIQNCLFKHGLNEEPKAEYCLVQQLPNGNELVFPDHCNVYYAVNSNAEPLTFQLRKRKS